jgi:hypothetical protein
MHLGSSHRAVMEHHHFDDSPQNDAVAEPSRRRQD